MIAHRPVLACPPSPSPPPGRLGPIKSPLRRRLLGHLSISFTSQQPDERYVPPVCPLRSTSSQVSACEPLGRHLPAATAQRRCRFAPAPSAAAVPQVSPADPVAASPSALDPTTPYSPSIAHPQVPPLSSRLSALRTRKRESPNALPAPSPWLERFDRSPDSCRPRAPPALARRGRPANSSLASIQLARPLSAAAPAPVAAHLSLAHQPTPPPPARPIPSASNLASLPRTTSSTSRPCLNHPLRSASIRRMVTAAAAKGWTPAAGSRRSIGRAGRATTAASRRCAFPPRL